MKNTTTAFDINDDYEIAMKLINNVGFIETNQDYSKDFAETIIKKYKQMKNPPHIILMDTSGLFDISFCCLKKAGLPVMRLTLQQVKQVRKYQA